MCPKPQIEGFASAVLNMYPLYVKGILAVSGGVLDQPNVYLDSMAIIANVYSEYESEGA